MSEAAGNIRVAVVPIRDGRAAPRTAILDNRLRSAAKVARQRPSAERSNLVTVTGQAHEIAPRSRAPAKDTKVAKTLWPLAALATLAGALT